jgi:predicted nucleic acid-binding protein
MPGLGVSVGDAPEILVLDASVGVKWFKPEAGRDEAMQLLALHRDGQVRIAVPSLFAHELLAVAVRHGGPEFGRRVWELLQGARLSVVGLHDGVVAEALAQCDALGCSFYDALAPAVAVHMGAQLVSADERAHGGFEGVRILGG